MNKILLKKKIKELELELLKPTVRKNKKILKELIDDNFVEIASTGIVINKNDVLESLLKENKIEWKVSNMKVVEIAEGLFLVTYKVTKSILKNNTKISSLRSSIWKNYNGKFKIIFHQGTLIK